MSGNVSNNCRATSVPVDIELVWQWLWTKTCARLCPISLRICRSDKIFRTEVIEIRKAHVLHAINFLHLTVFEIIERMWCYEYVFELLCSTVNLINQKRIAVNRRRRRYLYWVLEYVKIMTWSDLKHTLNDLYVYVVIYNFRLVCIIRVNIEVLYWLFIHTFI
jgi:hypothetical protein